MLIHHHLCSCLSAFSDMPQQVQLRKHFCHRNGITAQYNTDAMSVCQRQQLHWSIIAVHHSMFLRTVLHVKHRNSCPSWPAWYNEFRVGTLLQCSTTDLVTSRWNFAFDVTSAIIIARSSMPKIVKSSTIASTENFRFCQVFCWPIRVCAFIVGIDHNRLCRPSTVSWNVGMLRRIIPLPNWTLSVKQCNNRNKTL